MTLVIFLKNGKTLLFEDIEILKDAQNELIFTYFGVSTNVRRRATFDRHAIAGTAVEEPCAQTF